MTIPVEKLVGAYTKIRAKRSEIACVQHQGYSIVQSSNGIGQAIGLLCTRSLWIITFPTSLKNVSIKPMYVSS